MADLSRDTDNAANSLSPIFDKEKEQRRLAQAQAIAQIGTQVLDIYSTNEAIKATKAATEKLKDPQTQLNLSRDAEKQLKDEGQEINAKSVADRAYKLAYDSAIKAQGADIGSSQRQAVTAVIGALQGLAGGDIKSAIASGAAPYLANGVKAFTYGDKTYEQLTSAEKATNLMAHAILGGVIAEMKGGSATAGATGAVSGELAASAIMSALYGDKNPKDLSPEEKETVSNLSTLAGGIAAGLATNSTAGGVAGAQSAKNAVENNYLNFTEARDFDKEMTACKAAGEDCQPVIDKYAEIHRKNSESFKEECQRYSLNCTAGYERLKLDGGISAAERPTWLYGSLDNEEVKNAVLYINNQDKEFASKHSDNWDRLGAFIAEPENVFGLFMGGKALLNSNASAKAKVTGTGLSMGANAAVQVGNGNTGDKFDYLSFSLAGFTGWTGTGRSLHSNIQLNAGSAYFGSQVTGQDSEAAVVGSMFGTTLGYGAGSALTSQLEAKAAKNYFGMPASKNALKYAEQPVYSNFMSGEVNLSPLPGILGGFAGSFELEMGGSAMSSYIMNNKKTDDIKINDEKMNEKFINQNSKKDLDVKESN
ncbi:VENN motif pre-toxin domain-containing protein [Xenorhabdus griffiniae]|uniref:VENN motif pre-toxin domain-containing protein n=1 Tax=Xenorhabdus griffiniae TaxID=351672 RepID=UPI0030D1F9B3